MQYIFSQFYALRKTCCDAQFFNELKENQGKHYDSAEDTSLTSETDIQIKEVAIENLQRKRKFRQHEFKVTLMKKHSSNHNLGLQGIQIIL